MGNSEPAAAGGETIGEGEEDAGDGGGEALEFSGVDLFGARGKKESSKREKALANAKLAFESFYLLAQVLLITP